MTAMRLNFQSLVHLYSFLFGLDLIVDAVLGKKSVIFGHPSPLILLGGFVCVITAFSAFDFIKTWNRLK